jgi:hypothetical protein
LVWFRGCVLCSRVCSLTHRVDRLLGNTTYCFRTRGVNAVATGPWSVPPREGPGDCFVTTAADPPDAPVMLPLPLKTTSTSIRVGWTEPHSNGRPILNYTVERDNFWDDGPLAQVYVGGPRDLDFVTNDSMLPATKYVISLLLACMRIECGVCVISLIFGALSGVCEDERRVTA